MRLGEAGMEAREEKVKVNCNSTGVRNVSIPARIITTEEGQQEDIKQ